MKLPNFLIIGAPKAGTTTLFNLLKQHPDIYFSPLKEPHFFSHGLSGNTSVSVEKFGKLQSPITDLDDYSSLFKDVKKESAIGEASTSYLIHDQAPERIKHFLPQTKLIAVLRNPVQRAYSAFLMKCRIQGVEMTDTEDLLKRFQVEVEKSYSSNNTGLYSSKLKNYLKYFSWEQLQIFLFEDLKYSPETVVEEAFLFLGVDHHCAVEVGAVHNAGGIPKSKLLYNTLEGVRNQFNSLVRPYVPDRLLHVAHDYYSKIRVQTLSKPPIVPQMLKEKLLELYRDDIFQLQDLLQRDLSAWLE